MTPAYVNSPPTLPFSLSVARCGAQPHFISDRVDTHTWSSSGQLSRPNHTQRSGMMTSYTTISIAMASDY